MHITLAQRINYRSVNHFYNFLTASYNRSTHTEDPEVVLHETTYLHIVIAGINR